MPEVTIDVIAKDMASTVLEQIGNLMEGGAVSTAAFAAAATAAATAVFALADAAGEAAENQARLDVAYRNAAGAVGLSKTELADFTTQLSRTAGIEDDLIVRSEAVAMTFQSLSGDTFKRTITAAADLSAMFGGDLVTSTQKLGRALETFDGYTVLTREIGKFTPAQKAALDAFKESNNLIGYQSYLLDILEGRFKGTAVAVNEAGTGWAGMNVELKALTDNIGMLMLPEVQNLTKELTSMLRAVNDNIYSVSMLYYTFDLLRRSMMAFSSLGITEVIRSLQGAKETNPLISGDYSKVPGFVPTQGLPSGVSHASGGSFVIPAQYGSEGFRLGNYGTASGGERVTITPSNSTGGGMVTIGTLNIGNTAGMGRGEIVSMIEDAFVQAMGTA
jgi:hypothetical protein